ncbi:MAG: class I SAM-dependent methyltransferase, partial [Tabrizicola sp.]
MTSTDDTPAEDTPRGLPVVRLKPKAEARAIRHGFPWVYADELVTDRRTQGLAPGALAVLEDGERRPLGLVTVNMKSKIIARMLDRDPEAVIDQDWFATRLSRALAHRARLYPQPFYRLVHAEADGLPGVVIDRFGDTAVVQPNAAWAEAHLSALVAALVAVTGVTTVIKNGAGRARGLEGLAEEIAVVQGEGPRGPVPVPMNGATYMADLVGGQKTGLFFDQRENHAFAARLAGGAKVLDVFSHVGGFALAALAGGAESALAVDASAPALVLAGQGAAASG